MQNRMKTWMGVLIAAICLSGSSYSFAADDKPLTQGEAAIMLVQRLNLSGSSVKPPTEEEAFDILTENQITPFDGWQGGQPLLVKDLAKILVEALKKGDEITDKDNPAAYSELLTRDYGLDLSSIAAAIGDVGSLPNPEGSGVVSDQTTSDPLNDRIGGGPDETTGGTTIAPEFSFIVSQEFFEQAFVQIAGPVAVFFPVTANNP